MYYLSTAMVLLLKWSEKNNWCETVKAYFFLNSCNIYTVFLNQANQDAELARQSAQAARQDATNSQEIADDLFQDVEDAEAQLEQALERQRDSELNLEEAKEALESAEINLARLRNEQSVSEV